jgi:hypothetical protein
MDRFKINQQGLNKLLYSDNSEDKQRNYLNINLLRYLKNYLLQSMSEKERGCINLYHLENYLIERALDPSTEEIYKNGEELIRNTLIYLRLKPFYWILNSEVYLEIVGNSCYDDNYVNKDLIAIYNYIYNGKFRKEERTQESTTDPEFDLVKISNLYDLYDDPCYIEFVEFLDCPDYLYIDPSKKLIFDSNLPPLIFSYLKGEIADNKNFKLQNLILFFSYVSYHPDLDTIWNTVKPENEIFNNTKKYNLRLNKMNEDEMDEMYIQKQIKIFELQEKLTQIKTSEKVAKFFNFLKENKVN